MEHSKESIYISFRTQFENLGDCIINLLLMEEVAKSRRLRVLCREVPEWILRRLENFDSCEVDRSFAPWIKSAIGEAVKNRRQVVFHFKPGHYTVASNWRARQKSMGMIGFSMLSRLVGIRFRRIGVSLGEQTSLSKYAETWIGSCHDLYCLRDLDSLAFAQSLGIDATYSPDMAFLLPYPKVPVFAPNRQSFAVNFRSRQWLTHTDGILPELVDAIKGVSRCEKLAPTVVSQVTHDDKLMDLLAERLSTKVVSFAQDEQTAMHIFDTYAQCRFAVSNRLHCLIFAWAQGALPIPIVDPQVDQKIVDLFDTLGLGLLILDSDKLRDLAEHVQRILQSEDSWRRKIDAAFLEQQQLLVSLINSGEKPALSSLQSERNVQHLSHT